MKRCGRSASISGTCLSSSSWSRTPNTIWRGSISFPGAVDLRTHDLIHNAVRLGYVSDCRSLSEVDYDAMLDWALGHIRAELGIEDDLLRAYYAIQD